MSNNSLAVFILQQMFNQLICKKLVLFQKIETKQGFCILEEKQALKNK